MIQNKFRDNKTVSISERLSNFNFKPKESGVAVPAFTTKEEQEQAKINLEKGLKKIEIKEQKTYGKEIPREDLLKLFEPDDGTINLYYGRIGNGKTYAATADILDALQRGEVVYANWHVEVPENDQRYSFLLMLYGLFGIKRRFFRFPKENFHYFSPDDVDVAMLSGLTDCRVFIDEGQWIFDSYEGTRFSKEKRRLILHTRHCNRELNIITQRPTAIQVSARGNVNIFYKCEKLVDLFGFKLFRRTEHQDMIGETVDETQYQSRKYYLGSKRVYNAYNSKYMRGGIPNSQEVYFQAWILSWTDRWYYFRQICKGFSPANRRLNARSAPTMGGKQSITSLKNTERLNTVRVGEQDSLPF